MNPAEQHVREAQAGESVPYVAEYRVARDFTFPHRFDCREFKGLRYCEVLLNPDAQAAIGAKLVTFWRDRVTFNDQAETFGTTAGVSQLLWQGRQVRVELRDKPKWWTKIMKVGVVWIVIVHLIAVGAALQTLANHYDTFLGVGQVHPHDNPQEYDSLEERPFGHAYRVRNTGSVKTALAIKTIQIVSDRTGPTAGVTLDTAAGRQDFPDIAPGKIESIAIRGHAAKTGKYRILVNGSVESGWFRRDSSFSQHLQLRVWSRVSHDSWEIERCDPQSCWYRFTLSSGIAYPTGLGMAATLGGVADVEIAIVQGGTVNEVNKPRSVKRAGAEATEIEWSTYRLDPMQDSTFALKVRGTKSRTREEWQEVGKKIELRHFAAEELKK
jgi:hypothetical protein